MDGLAVDVLLFPNPGHGTDEVRATKDSGRLVGGLGLQQLQKLEDEEDCVKERTKLASVKESDQAGG
jgi:hypothetical protein